MVLVTLREGDFYFNETIDVSIHKIGIKPKTYFGLLSPRRGEELWLKGLLGRVLSSWPPGPRWRMLPLMPSFEGRLYLLSQILLVHVMFCFHDHLELHVAVKFDYVLVY